MKNVPQSIDHIGKYLPHWYIIWYDRETVKFTVLFDLFYSSKGPFFTKLLKVREKTVKNAFKMHNLQAPSKKTDSFAWKIRFSFRFWFKFCGNVIYQDSRRGICLFVCIFSFWFVRQVMLSTSNLYHLR